ncbi:MAG: hypothetical protein FWE23_08000 [Chitinivibrionia bacterium]|nr:hypothetical protein [Chitinivibrionia bacterium]
MLEEMITELDDKVGLLINKNIQYKNEMERLRTLLDGVIDNSCVSQPSDNELFRELRPLAQSILAHIEKAGGGEQTYA